MEIRFLFSKDLLSFSLDDPVNAAAWLLLQHEQLFPGIRLCQCLMVSPLFFNLHWEEGLFLLHLVHLSAHIDRLHPFVLPFREEQRRQNPSATFGETWLFFGCRHRDRDFMFRWAFFVFLNAKLMQTDIFICFACILDLLVFQMHVWALFSHHSPLSPWLYCMKFDECLKKKS